MRIENEQRIMFNSRLEVLGGSNVFTLNNIVQDEMERKSFSPMRETRGVVIKINGEHNSSVDARNIHDFDDSSSLDSFALLNQIANRDSMSNSIYSSDQTKILS